MKISRREFIRLSAMSGVAAASLGAGLLSFPTRAYASRSPGLRKWVQPLRGVGPAGIPVAAPDATLAPVTGVTHYTIEARQFTDLLHPDMGVTSLYGYHPVVALGGGVQAPKHLGGIVVVNKGTPLQFTFRNTLPRTHILPVDTSLPGANLPPDRIAVHLHGGHIPWISDGGPFDWWGTGGTHGPSFLNNVTLNPGALVNEAEYFYPNNQSARFMWYHDHAEGITRLNAYAGLATAYLIRDTFEGNLRNQGLPDYVENGGREIPIIIQDKVFVDALTIAALDPTWPGPKTTGSLWYPHVYGRLLVPAPADPSVVPEMFGDTMLANGLAYPDVVVEPRRYRLRILNACNSRFVNLQTYVDDGSPDGITHTQPAAGRYVPANLPGPDFLIIGTEGGFLKSPVLRPSNLPFMTNVDALGNSTYSGSLITGPAERWDILVDFSAFAGKKIILYNDAPAPFPVGDPLNDFFFGNAGNPGSSTITGLGSDTRQILRFSVGTTVTPPADGALAISPVTDFTAGIDPFLALYDAAGFPIPPAGLPVRQLTINEDVDAFGRLVQTLGTNVAVAQGKFGRLFWDPVTENPTAGSIEIWEIANLSADSHPMHFHLFNAQVLWRRPFNMLAYAGVPTYTGPQRPPEPEERGWKETILMHPGEVTAIIMQFNLPTVPFMVPASPRVGGNEYVYHCHILEHEEHDMMRPLVVI